MSFLRIALPWAAMLLVGCPSLTRPTGEDPLPEPGTVAAAKPAATPTVTAAQTVVPPPAPTPRPELIPPDEEKIQASHILVSWAGAGPSKEKRTKEEAKKRIEEVIAKLKKGGDFAKLAAEYGEDGTKARGGDLGMFGRKNMVAPFSEAAFKLKVGEISGVVETTFGYHVIKRTK